MTIGRDDLADPGQRVGAVVVDGLLIGGPWLLLGVLQYWDQPMPGWFRVLSTVAFGVYEIVCTALWGQTVGKRLIGIRVCTREDLSRPGWLRAAKRWGIFVVAGFLPIVGEWAAILITLPLLWTADRRGLHDMLAGTLVLRDDAVRRRAASAAELESEE